MKKMAKVAALLAAMALTSWLTACQKDGSPRASAKDAAKAAAHLVMEETAVMSYTDGLPANLVIPEGVTAIGERAFEYCKSVKSVVIPGSVTSVGDSAFSRCKGLASVTVGKGVTSIGHGAFWNCGRLASVVIPDSVTSIGNFAFSRCKSLESVDISCGVTSIGDCAFSECKSLASVKIPASVTEIRKRAFENCNNLKEIKFAGTKAQWETIEKGSKNVDACFEEYIGSFVVHCADGDITQK